MRQSATISDWQLTPVTYNHRLRWLAAASPRDRFFSRDTHAVVSVPDSIVRPLFNESMKPGVPPSPPTHSLLHPLPGSKLHIRGEKSEAYSKCRSPDTQAALESKKKKKKVKARVNLQPSSTKR